MPNKRIKIRKLKTKDLPRAAEIFYKSFNSVGENWDLETAIKRLKQCSNSKSCWVAEINTNIVGFITGKLDNVLDHQQLYIDLIAVEPEYHRSGIGSKLLRKAEKYAKTKGYKALWLSASTNLPSFDWYIKTGFKETSWKSLVKVLEEKK